MSQGALQAALVDFTTRQARANNRQRAIQQYCCEELGVRGVAGVTVEVCLRGAYRAKDWDVALTVGEEPLLAISCKSIIANHAGTVPNRVDDMLGEAANIHRRWPHAVLGYLFMMSRVDTSVASVRRRGQRIAGGHTEEALLVDARAAGARWFERLSTSVASASGRSGPDDLPEKFEAVSCALIGFDAGPPFPVEYHPATLSTDAFFDSLVATFGTRFG